jgi:UDP:flavonoid glycosyltransferase YjiC (YdhE family)
MRIGIQTWGSEGDIRPLVALAGGLSAAGHEVNLVVTDVDDRDYGPIASRLGFQVRHVATPVVADREEFESIGVEIVEKKNPFKQAMLITEKLFDPVVEPMFEAAMDLCAQSDLAIGHFLLYPLGAAAEKHNIPDLRVFTAPVSIPSRHKGPSGVPQIANWLNALVWRLMGSVINWKLLPDVNALRTRAGLYPEKDMMLGAWASRYLNLIAVSPILCRHQPDWGRRFNVSGFFNLPEGKTAWEIPKELEDFLKAGEPPVYMTFGSLTPKGKKGDFELNRMVDLFSAASSLAGCRAIIQVPGSAVQSLDSNGQTCFTPPMPHKEIFPKCAAVVHHGGAGTTQSSLRAGAPSIVVAHIQEQTFWAGELRRLGVAPKFLWRRSATPEALARRLRTVLDTPSMRTRAEELGAVMQKENGVGRAVEALNEFISGHFGS